jgi:hypothetical protein
MTPDIPDRVADAGFAVSAASFGITLASSVQVIQIVAGCVAIAAGTMAFIYHFMKWRKERDQK